jgi:formate dehydrogenase maturation protein FdhE
MLQVPSRAHAYKGGTTIPRPLKIACPKCGAAPGWSCVKLGHDLEGKPFVIRKLKYIHPERQTRRA